MDILTPKGQQTRAQEREAISLFERHFPVYTFTETPKDRPAYIDGIVSRDGVALHGVEVKCRNMTREQLRSFEDRWLVTHDKITRGISLCQSLGIGYRGFLYLVPDKLLLIVPIWNYGTGLACEMDVEPSSTQETVNGGTITRLNAYISVAGALEVSEAP